MTDRKFSFGAFELDTATEEIWRESKRLDVEPRVFKFIEYLIRHRDRVVAKEEIDREIWGGRAVSPASLSVCASNARKVLSDNTSRQTLLRTYYGRGYRFVGRVTETFFGRSEQGPRFIGREQEVHKFVELFSHSTSSLSGVVMIHGEPGAGKSSLAREIEKIAQNFDISTSFAECPEYDGSMMLSPWAQTLDQIGKERNVLETPDLALLGAGRSRHTTVAGEDLNIAKRRFFEAVSEIVRASTKQHPLLLIFDDIHRADALSLDLIRFVSIDLSARDLMILCTYRTSELISNETFGACLSSLNALPKVDHVHLEGLDVDAIAELANHQLGHPVDQKIAAYLRSVTNGNPLYLQSVLSLAHRSQSDFIEICQSTENQHAILPHDLSATIVAHLSTLPHETFARLEDASVIGRRFSIEILAQVTRAEHEAIERSLADAVDRGFIRKSSKFPIVYEFSHIIVRDAVYSTLKSSKRAETHRRVSLALSKLAEVDVGALAYHRYESGDPGSFEILVSAADSAEARFDYAEAASYMKRALEVLGSKNHSDVERLDCLLKLGRCQVKSSSRREAFKTFAEAACIAKAHGAPEEYARVALECAPDFLSIESGTVDTELVDLVREADAAIDRNSKLGNLVAARLLLAIAWSPRCENEAQELRIRLESYCASHPENDVLVRTLPAIWVSDWAPDRIRERLRYGEQIFESPGTPLVDSQLVCLSFYMSSLLESGQIDLYFQWIDRFATHAKRTRHPQALWYSQMFRSLTSLLKGNFEDAATDQRNLATAAQLAEDKNGLISACLHKAQIDWEKRRPEEAIASIDIARKACPEIKGWKIAQAPFEIDRGRPDVALDTFGEFERRGFSNYGKLIDWVHMFTVGFAEVCAELKLSRPATELYGLLLDLKGREATSGVGVMALGSADRYLGLLAFAENNFDRAKGHFRESIQFDESIGANPWVVRAKYDLARCHFRNGEGEEASSVARAALSEAKSMGMDNIAFKAERLLRKAARRRMGAYESAKETVA